MILPTIIIGSRLAIALIHSMTPSLALTVPDVSGGVGDEWFEGADAFRGQLRQQRLPVDRMCRLVSGRQRLRRATEFPDFERSHGASGLIHHRRGQVRREVVGAGDRLVDGVPTTYGVKAGVPDPMDGSFLMHLLVERVRILYVLIVKQCQAEATIQRCHSSTLIGDYEPRQQNVGEVAIRR